MDATPHQQKHQNEPGQGRGSMEAGAAGQLQAALAAPPPFSQINSPSQPRTTKNRAARRVKPCLVVGWAPAFKTAGASQLRPTRNSVFKRRQPPAAMPAGRIVRAATRRPHRRSGHLENPPQVPECQGV